MHVNQPGRAEQSVPLAGNFFFFFGRVKTCSLKELIRGGGDFGLVLKGKIPACLLKASPKGRRQLCSQLKH